MGRTASYGLEWNPNIGVGVFRFGDRTDRYISAMGPDEFPDEYDEDVGWKVYGWLNPELRVFVEDDKIVSVACYDECWYRGVNLIGTDLSKAIACIGSNPEDDPEAFDIDGETEVAFDFDEVNAQLWVKENIVIAVMYGFSPEEENPDPIINRG